MGEDEARRLFRRDAAGKSIAATNTQAPYASQQPWPSGWNLQGPDMQPAANPYSIPSSPYSAEPWPRQTWQTLHPDSFEISSPATISDISRSSSPNNPADLQNFGHPLPDGRSWRCAHPGCTSQATFTRGCDLRKHFRRRSFAVMKIVLSRLREAFQARRIETGMRPSTNRVSRASGKDATEDSAVLIT